MTVDRVLLPTAEPAAVRSCVRRLLRGEHRTIALAGLTLIGSAAATIVTLRLFGVIVDIVHDGRGGHPLGIVAGSLLVVTLTGAALGLVADLLMARVGDTALARLREEVVEHTLDLPVQQVEDAGRGDIATRVGGDVALVADAVQRVLPGVLFSGVTIILTLAGLAALDWRFALAAALALPIQLRTLRWYVRRCIPLYEAERVSDGELAGQLLSTLGGAATVRAYGIAAAHVDRVDARSSATNELAYAGTCLRTRLYGRLNLAELIGLSAVLATGLVLVRSDVVTVGAATAAALYFHTVFDPVNSVVSLLDNLLVARVSLARLVGIVDLPARVPQGESPRPADASLRFDHVDHAYVAGHPSLCDISFDVRPGERLAVVGASGAGKSTLAKLAVGVHEPRNGTVVIGGVSVDRVDPATRSRTIALVTQEVHVFSGTLRDDLLLARPDAEDDVLTDALARIGADWFAALPEGLDTRVGHDGRTLTALEAQQLALARLALTSPSIVVLDEATAEAGSAGARHLEASADVAIGASTAIVIAHRLTQAESADRIVVLDRGRIVEVGTHPDLIAGGGPYAALWTAWSSTKTTPRR